MYTLCTGGSRHRTATKYVENSIFLKQGGRSCCKLYYPARRCWWWAIFIHKHLQRKRKNFCFIFSEFLALSDPSVLPDLWVIQERMSCFQWTLREMLTNTFAKEVQATIAIAWFSYFLSLREAWEGLYGKDLLKELWNGWIGAMVEYSKRSSSQNCQHGKILMIFLWNIHFSREGGLYNNKLGEIVCPNLVSFNFRFSFQESLWVLLFLLLIQKG